MNPIKPCSMYYYLTYDAAKIKRVKNLIGPMYLAEKAEEWTES